VSYMPRVMRLAARVSEARRPKRLRAAPQAPDSPVERRVSAQSVSSEPIAGVTLADAHAWPPAPTLPISDEAVRWLTQGAVPARLVPLLGDPAFPVDDTEATHTPVLPATAEPVLAPTREPSIPPAAAEHEAPRQDVGHDSGPGHVLARVVEGARDPAPPAGSRAGQGPEEDDHAIGSRGQSAWARPLTTIEEISRPARDGQPLLRLARAPARSPAVPTADVVAAPATTVAAAELAPDAAAAPAPDAAAATPDAAVLATVSVDRALELARQTGAELSSDGPGRSTVTFPAGDSLGGSIAGAAGGGSATSRSRDAQLAPESANASPARESRDVTCSAETPLASSVRERLGDLDLDAIYDGFLYRLRRDLLHDRERLGDLLGPIR
jgi:hypothetical protein